MIAGDKVMLRAVEPDDIRQLWEWLQDEELMRLRDFPAPPTSFEAARREFEQASDDCERNLRLAITTLEGELIGETSLREIDQRNGDAVFTIAIGNRDYWSHGYGSDVTRCLMKYAFEMLNLHRVTLFVHSSNERAIHAYRKVGFQVEGTLREAHYMDGRHSDVLIMGLLREDFRGAEVARAAAARTTIPTHV